MKNIKRIAILSACAALAGSMTAGAAKLPVNVQIKSVQIGGGQYGSFPSQALQQLIDQICGGIANRPVTPDIKPGDPGQTPVAPLPGEGETENTPVTPDIKPGDPGQTPVAPLPGEGGTENTPVTPDIKPGDPGQTPVAPLPGEDHTPETPEQPEEKPETPDEMPAYAAEVVRLVNAERTKAGLPALAVDTKATTAAQVRAREQAQSFSHTRPNGAHFTTALTEAGAAFRSAGENIAWGQQTPEAVMQSWMNSAGHRANILSTQYTSIGVGYAQIGGKAYWTQLFIS